MERKTEIARILNGASEILVNQVYGLLDHPKSGGQITDLLIREGYHPEYGLVLAKMIVEAV